ncbi:hypothetical protein NUACC26_041150 [Scytonema sp. NUACC26]
MAIHGTSGNDVLNGNNGFLGLFPNDTIYGKTGNDRSTGGCCISNLLLA